MNDRKSKKDRSQKPIRRDKSKEKGEIPRKEKGFKGSKGSNRGK